MGKWLAAFRDEMGAGPDRPPHANSADSAKSPACEGRPGPFGANGAFGTGVKETGTLGHADLLALTALTARGERGQSAHVRDEQDMRDDFEELAARLEFQCGMTRNAAERQARAKVYGPGAAVWTLDPTRRSARPLTDAEVDAMLRDRRTCLNG